MSRITCPDYGLLGWSATKRRAALFFILSFLGYFRTAASAWITSTSVVVGWKCRDAPRPGVERIAPFLREGFLCYESRILDDACGRFSPFSHACWTPAPRRRRSFSLPSLIVRFI